MSAEGDRHFGGNKQVSLPGSVGGPYADTVDANRLFDEGELEIATEKIGFDDFP